ncbi:hypothetical protein Droror1_Dr00017520 [Drosera rotundifolia]
MEKSTDDDSGFGDGVEKNHRVELHMTRGFEAVEEGLCRNGEEASKYLRNCNHDDLVYGDFEEPRFRVSLGVKDYRGKTEHLLLVVFGLVGFLNLLFVSCAGAGVVELVVASRLLLRVKCTLATLWKSGAVRGWRPLPVLGVGRWMAGGLEAG